MSVRSHVTTAFTLALLTLGAGPALAGAQGTSVLSLLPTQGRVAVGEERTSALSTADLLSPDDRFLEAWELNARAGQSLTVDVISDAFDTRLHVVGPGLSETLTQDDGGNGCNSRLTFTALENGTFRLVASSASSRETGTYTLRVSDRPGPPPTHDCGEADPSALLALPLDGRQLEMGSVGTGRLGPSSTTVQEGRPAEAWALVGRPGERVVVLLQSDDFDAYLYMTGPGLDGVLTDDDSGGSLDSRLEVTLPTAGPYRVVAAALSSGGSGAYTVRVEAPVDLMTLSTDGRTIDLGQSVAGQLRDDDPVLVDGRRGQLWEYAGTAGQRIVIDLVADDFDAYLYLIGPGISEPISDDDGGGDLNSRIETTLPETGTYRIITSSLSSGTGVFTLSVRPS